MNARADILAALLSSAPGGLNAADLARSTRFTKPNIASALDSLVLAGLVVILPAVLGYTWWSYSVFRGKVTGEHKYY